MNHLLKKVQFLKAIVFPVCFVLFFSNPVYADSTGQNLLADLEEALVSLADKVRPSVVSISAYVPPSPSIRRQGDQSGVAR